MTKGSTPPAQPKVSVILTSYNHAQFIGTAIESVMRQTFSDFELIIWDDCSSDSSAEVVKQYQDTRIVFIRNPINLGPTYGVNRSIEEHCRGHYIAIHHSDDEWLPNKLEEQVTFLDKHPDIGAVFSQAEAMDERGNALATSEHFYSSVFNQANRSRHEWLRFFLLSGNALCHPSVLIRKLCYEKIGAYRHDLFQLPDYDMWIRLCSQYEIHVIQKPLLRFRVLDGERNTSGNRVDTRIRAMYERMRIMETFESHLTLADLRQMFPEVNQLNEIQDGNVRLGLAAVIFETRPFASAQLYALNVIASQMQELNWTQTETFVGSKSWPSLQDFFKVTGQTDVFGLSLRERLDTSSIEVLRLQAHVNALEVANRAITQSRSWRFMAPLRAFSDLLRRAK